MSSSQSLRTRVGVFSFLYVFTASLSRDFHGPLLAQSKAWVTAPLTPAVPATCLRSSFFRANTKAHQHWKAAKGRHPKTDCGCCPHGAPVAPSLWSQDSSGKTRMSCSPARLVSEGSPDLKETGGRADACYTGRTDGNGGRVRAGHETTELTFALLFK